MKFDIFLVHVKQDRDRVAPVAYALDDCGWKVWSDVMFPPSDGPNSGWIEEASCVLAFWSENSVDADRLVEDAYTAKRRGVLVQAVLDDVRPPLGLRDLQYAYLVGWTGDKEAVHFRALRDAISNHVRPQPRILLPESESDGGGSRGNRASESSRLHERHNLAPGRHVFLSYRRQDTQGETGRLHDKLTAIYGPDSVFMDVDNVPYGADFVDYIQERLSSVAVMIVVIGKEWSTVTDGRNRRRLEQPDDLVRVEIAEAFKRRIPVIPVLVQNTPMPVAEDLPEEIRRLTRRNALELSHSRWRYDVDQLLRAVESILLGGESTTS